MNRRRVVLGTLGIGALAVAGGGSAIALASRQPAARRGRRTGSRSRRAHSRVHVGADTAHPTPSHRRLARQRRGFACSWGPRAAFGHSRSGRYALRDTHHRSIVGRYVKARSSRQICTGHLSHPRCWGGRLSGISPLRERRCTRTQLARRPHARAASEGSRAGCRRAPQRRRFEFRKRSSDYLTSKPCSEGNRFAVRASRMVKAKYGFAGYVQRYFAPNAWFAPEGSVVTIAGPMYLLVGPGTFSSAQSFSETVQEYGIATLVGKPLGEPANSNGQIFPVRAPRTCLNASIASKFFTRSSRGRTATS